MLKNSRATSVIKKPTLDLSIKTVFDERSARGAREGLSKLGCTIYGLVANEMLRTPGKPKAAATLSAAAADLRSFEILTIRAVRNGQRRRSLALSRCLKQPSFANR